MLLSLNDALHGRKSDNQIPIGILKLMQRRSMDNPSAVDLWGTVSDNLRNDCQTPRLLAISMRPCRMLDTRIALVVTR